jgi:hypothetical protein
MLRILLPLAALVILLGYPLYIYFFSDRELSTRQIVHQKHLATIPYQRFGKGSLSDFAEYLRRPSAVEIKSVRELCEWLMGCQYVHDQTQFENPDIWQHPVDFEVTRQGDCEDHALWAWRKLCDLGFEAEFVVGRLALPKGVWVDHSWIVLTDYQGEHLLETTAKRMDQFMVPLPVARQRYRPYLGIDTHLRTFAYPKPRIISGG